MAPNPLIVYDLIPTSSQRDKKTNEYKYFSYLLLLAAVTIAGCGDSKLACNDSEAKTRVLEVIHSHIDTMGGFDTYMKPHIGKRYISDISTTMADKELGRYECSATYNFEYKGNLKTAKFSYALEYLEDKKTSEASANLNPIRSAYLVADALKR